MTPEWHTMIIDQDDYAVKHQLYNAKVYPYDQQKIFNWFGHMIKICTVYFEGMYSPNYVTNLYRSLKKHATVPFPNLCV